MIIGIFNRVFYDSDALLSYGLWGIVLVGLRHLSNKCLVFLTIILYAISIIFHGYSLLPLLFGDSVNFVPRYAMDMDTIHFFSLFPQNTVAVLLGNIFGLNYIILANFILGYVIGRIGIVDKWDSSIRARHIVRSSVVYFISMILMFYLKFVEHYDNTNSLLFLFQSATYLSGAFCYSILFIYAYNNLSSAKRLFGWFESYGRCGLTNYSTQGIIGVLLFKLLGIAFYGISFTYLVIGSVLFFLMQNLFCIAWLSRFKNGPMEYVWRSATERKWLPYKK